MNEMSELLNLAEQSSLELRAAIGYIKALEYGLHAVIATLPETDHLKALWRSVLAHHEEHQSAGLEGRLGRVAMEQGMERLSDLILKPEPATPASKQMHKGQVEDQL